MKAIVKSIEPHLGEEGVFNIQITFSLLRNGALEQYNFIYPLDIELGITRQVEGAVYDECDRLGFDLESCVVPMYNI